MRKATKKEVKESMQDAVLFALFSMKHNITEETFYPGDYNGDTQELIADHKRRVLDEIQRFRDTLARRWGMQDWHGFNKEGRAFSITKDKK